MRLGIAKPGTTQPLRIVMNSIEDKRQFMKNLHRLKGADPHLRKISITDDHTIAERKEISMWIMKAKERTAADTDGNVWKIRGSPHQNNLRLIKITNTTTKTNEQPRPKYERFIEAL